MATSDEPAAARRLDLDSDLALTPSGDGRFTATAPDHWWGFISPNGGFYAALALNAATQVVADPERRPVALTIHFVKNAALGAVALSVERVRAGRRATTCLVRMDQEGQIVALAIVVHATAADSEHSFDLTAMPDVPAPETIERAQVDLPGWPEYLKNFDMRLAGAHAPFAGAEEALIGGWMRLADPRRPDALAMAVYADAWAPAIFTRMQFPLPTPTAEMTVHFRDHDWFERAAPDDFVLAHFRATLFKDGQFTEDGTIWSPDGILLAEARQSCLLLQ